MELNLNYWKRKIKFRKKKKENGDFIKIARLDGYGNEITTSLAKSINNIQRFRVISVAIPFRSMHSISTDDGQLYFT